MKGRSPRSADASTLLAAAAVLGLAAVAAAGTSAGDYAALTGLLCLAAGAWERRKAAAKDRDSRARRASRAAGRLSLALRSLERDLAAGRQATRTDLAWLAAILDDGRALRALDESAPRLAQRIRSAGSSEQDIGRAVDGARRTIESISSSRAARALAASIREPGITALTEAVLAAHGSGADGTQEKGRQDVHQ